MKEFETFAELEASKQTKVGTRFICRERANAEYILQASGYTALVGDVTFSNGLIGELQVNTGTQITTVSLINSVATYPVDTVINTTGYTTSGDNGGWGWKQNGVVGQTISQSPTQLLNGLLNDGNGNQWALIAEPSRVNIKALGAVESTDATNAFKAAIASGFKYDVSGDYTISDSLTATSKVNLISTGGAITVADSSSVNPLFHLKNAPKSRVKGLVIDGNQANNTSLNIFFLGDDCEIVGNTISNAGQYGIYGLDVSGVYVHKNTVIDSQNIGIFIQAVTTNEKDNTITGNTVNRSALATTLTEGGIKVRGDQATYTQTRNKVTGNTVILPVNASTTSAICIEVFGFGHESAVLGNITDGGYMGISIDESNSVNVSSNVITNVPKYGIELAGSSNCTVLANAIDAGNIGSICEGIIISKAGSENNTISSNSIKGASFHAIRVALGNTGNSVLGNTVEHSAATDAIVIESDSNSVTGGTINGSSTCVTAIHVSQSSNCTVSGVVIKNAVTDAVKISTTLAAIDSVTVTGVSSNNSAYISLSVGGSGSAGARIKAIGNVRVGASYDWLDMENNVRVQTGTGAPEGVWVGGIGSTFYRTDGGAGTTSYVKETGTGNTGWVAK